MDETPEPKDQLRMLGMMWKMAMTTPALYMVVGLAVGKWVFEAQGRDGFWPLEAPAYKMVTLITVAVVMALALTVIWLTLSRPAPVAQALNPYRTRVYATLFIGDAIAFWGLVLYLIQGDAVAQGMLSLSAWIVYYIGRPSPVMAANHDGSDDTDDGDD